MNNIQTFYSQKNDINEAVFELKNHLSKFDTKVLLFFASSCYEPHALSKAMKDSFSESEVFGCTTAGEITTGKMLKNSIVVMAFNKDAIDNYHIYVHTLDKKNIFEK